MATSLVTGKSATFTYDSVQGEAQITSFSTEDTTEVETVETLGGSAPLPGKEEYVATVSFLFDGNTSGGGFYAALQAAKADKSSGTITFTVGTFSETGTAVVNALSKEVPADGAATCEATLTCSGMTPTYPTP
jgi:hypothetical protein